MFLLDDLLALPGKGLMAIFRRIAEMAEEELNDKSRIQGELQRLEFLYETDKITEEEYEEREAELLERLTQLEEQQEEQQEDQQEER